MAHFSELGFASYDEYLQSKHWQTINETWVYLNQPRYCWICFSFKDTMLHHETYDNLGNEDIYNDLVRLCRDCHERVHFPAPGIRTPLVKEELVAMRKALRIEYLKKYIRASTFFPFLYQLLYRLFW